MNTRPVSSRSRTAPVPTVAVSQGPGDLTLTSIVLFTLGAYGVAAGAATGQEAVVAVGVFAFTLFVVGIVWPVAALAHVDVGAVAPPDASVGDTLELRVEVKGRAPRLELRVLDPAGQWWRCTAPTTATVPHIAARRGVFSFVRVQVRSSAPLGVFLRTRTLRVEMPTPITVAPRPAPEAPILAPVLDEQFEASAPVFAKGMGDAVRAVRPYVPGDPARLVHWPSSARRGELVVREHEPPPATGVAIVLDLRGDAPEGAASRAMGLGVATIAAGGRVWCCTAERDGARSQVVGDARALGRRLARAVAGDPGTPPGGWHVEVVTA